MSTLIDGLGRVNLALIRLARKTGLEVSENITPEGMSHVLQAHWMQKGKMRFQIQGHAPDVEVLELLQEVGCIDEVHVPVDGGNLYDGALLLGAILARVRTRLAFLIEEYGRGVANFKRVYLLGSERPLNPEKEGPADLRSSSGKLPTNEIEMMQFVVGESHIPPDWEIVTVQSPNVPLPGAGSRPANTGDTFTRWQEETGLQEGRFLVVSNNPFVGYQETNARRILPREMKLRGIGPMANTQLPLETFLDNLAKQLYEEIKLRESFVEL